MHTGLFKIYERQPQFLLHIAHYCINNDNGSIHTCLVTLNTLDLHTLSMIENSAVCGGTIYNHDTLKIN